MHSDASFFKNRMRLFMGTTPKDGTQCVNGMRNTVPLRIPVWYGLNGLCTTINLEIKYSYGVRMCMGDVVMVVLQDTTLPKTTTTTVAITLLLKLQQLLYLKLQQLLYL